MLTHQCAAPLPLQVKSAAVSKKEKQKQGGGLPRAKPINLAALPNLTITVATGSAGQQRQAPQNRPGARRPVAGNKLKQRLGQRLGQGKTNRGGKPGQGGGKPGQQRAGGGKPGQQRAGGSKPSGGKGGRKIIVR